MTHRAILVTSAALLLGAVSASFGGVAKENPIRKVITLMQDMQKEIEVELGKEKDLYEKFLCICDTADDELAAAIEKATQQIADLSSRLESEGSEKKQLEEALKGHYGDKASSEQDLEKATTLREKEKAEAEETIASASAAIKGLDKAIPVLEKSTPSLMQSEDKTALEKFLDSKDAATLVDSYDRKMVLAFLSSSDGSKGSGEVVGILKQMREEMAKNLEDSTKNEATASAGFTDLKNIKDEEIEVASESIETKEKRAGELAVSISQNKDALEDAQTEKSDTEKFLAVLKVQCVEQKKAWEGRFKLRNDEMAAISEAIKILNDDDALEIFSATKKDDDKKASFLQKHKGLSKEDKALAILTKMKAADSKDLQGSDIQLSLLANVLSSRSRMEKKAGFKGKETGDFGGVLKMLDTMMSVLEKEQAVDAKKRDWCNTELEKAHAEEGQKQSTMDALTATVNELADEIASIDEQVKTLQQEIHDLDRAVADATEQRKKEHAEYADTASMTEAAVALIAKAKNRLNKFYNPSQYKEPASSAAFFAQVSGSAHRRGGVAPPPLPVMPEYKPAGGSGGILGLMDEITHELQMDAKEAEMEEQQAQKDYVNLMQQSQVSRAADLKGITDLQNSRAVLEEKINEAKGSKKMAYEELDVAHKYTSELHSTCDFVVENFELRAVARKDEIESLKSAKAVMQSTE